MFLQALELGFCLMFACGLFFDFELISICVKISEIDLGDFSRKIDCLSRFVFGFILKFF